MMFIVFMLGTFTVGMAEYVVTGLLTQIASDMKVSISSAGLLISVYAISVAVIGPFMRIFTLKVHGHRLLPILVAIFIISNLVGMLAPNFNVLLLSRLMSAAMHAPFFWRMYERSSCSCSSRKETTSDCISTSWSNHCCHDRCAIRIIPWWICQLENCIWCHDWFSCDYYAWND